jgi:hypothetical protein
MLNGFPPSRLTVFPAKKEKEYCREDGKTGRGRYLVMIF